MTSNATTAFTGGRLLAKGALAEVAVAVSQATTGGTVLVFDDATGKVVDLDLRGGPEAVRARYSVLDSPTSDHAGPERQRGRPRFCVVAREVTLLPRHWEWLAMQPGGASAVLRRLIDEARRAQGDEGRIKSAREAAWRFVMAIAGDRPGFEEASRAIFAGDRARFLAETAAWPADIVTYALSLAWPKD